ncbi:MAG: peptide deformylase [Candidatus Omnitrophica bacterium]|nr:peptide deformylase [Candidatus Omnitrophota bacterium]
MPATALKIRIYGDLILRKKAKPVLKVQPRHSEVLSAMAKIMYEGGGIGLAAPQVGLSESMIVVDVGNGLYKLINPIIVKREGFYAIEEGCLSLPGVCLKVKRARKVLVRALDESAKSLEIEAEGLLACCLQHEIDHLKGKLIVDYASFIDKLKIRKKLEELKKRSADESLSKSESKSCKLQL